MSLTNANDRGAEPIEIGMTSRSIHVPDRNGHLEDVVSGWDYLEGYPSNEPYFGAHVGRYANPIGDAKLDTDGQSFQLDAN